MYNTYNNHIHAYNGVLNTFNLFCGVQKHIVENHLHSVGAAFRVIGL